MKVYFTRKWLFRYHNYLDIQV